MKIKLIAISFILVILSALNSSSIGLLGIDVISTLLGFSPIFLRAVHALIGGAGVYLAIMMRYLIFK